MVAVTSSRSVDSLLFFTGYLQLVSDYELLGSSLRRGSLSWHVAPLTDRSRDGLRTFPSFQPEEIFDPRSSLWTLDSESDNRTVTRAFSTAIIYIDITSILDAST